MKNIVWPSALGVQHIIADRISKDKDTIEFLIRDACGKAHIMIEAHQSNAAKKDGKEEKKERYDRCVDSSDSR